MASFILYGKHVLTAKALVVLSLNTVTWPSTDCGNVRTDSGDKRIASATWLRRRLVTVTPGENRHNQRRHFGHIKALWLSLNIVDLVVVMTLLQRSDAFLGNLTSLEELFLALLQLAAVLYVLARFALVLGAVNVVLVILGLKSFGSWSRIHYFYYSSLVANIALASYLASSGLGS